MVNETDKTWRIPHAAAISASRRCSGRSTSIPTDTPNIAAPSGAERGLAMPEITFSDQCGWPGGFGSVRPGNHKLMAFRHRPPAQNSAPEVIQLFSSVRSWAPWNPFLGFGGCRFHCRIWSRRAQRSSSDGTHSPKFDNGRRREPGNFQRRARTRPASFNDCASRVVWLRSDGYCDGHGRGSPKAACYRRHRRSHILDGIDPVPAASNCTLILGGRRKTGF
jgi:hypothetical protein